MFLFLVLFGNVIFTLTNFIFNQGLNTNNIMSSSFFYFAIFRTKARSQMMRKVILFRKVTTPGVEKKRNRTVMRIIRVMMRKIANMMKRCRWEVMRKVGRIGMSWRKRREEVPFLVSHKVLMKIWQIHLR